MTLHWPAAYEPAASHLHVRNATTSAADPSAIWAWLTRPDLWGKFYRNAWWVRQDVGPWPTLAGGSRFRWVTLHWLRARIRPAVTVPGWATR